MSFEELLNELENDENEHCYAARIKFLKNKGRKTEIIENGISDVLQVMESGAKSFVIYGEPQSGKTEFMIALVCKLLDLGKKTIFVVMNDNTELETQNFERFREASELNPTPLRDFQVDQLSSAELKQDKKRVIFCRKNSRNLQTLITLCRFMTDRVLIDDEADYATPNAKINKNEITAINKHLETLGDLSHLGHGIYIGITATPARLDLNNTFLNDSKKWVFLESHDQYKGRSFFFPIGKEEIEKSDYQLVKLPDDGDNPAALRNSVFRYLLRVAILNADSSSELTPYSMLIHTAGKTNDHEADQKDVRNILSVLANKQHPKFESYANKMLDLANELISYYRCTFTATELTKFVIKNIGKHEVLVINHMNDSSNVQKAGKPKALFTFAIGGNIVSRGLTFENLLTFFFSRNVKGRLQQNTYIQRARMFGNRPYSNYFELCSPAQLFHDWANTFMDHELSLRLARAGAYQHIYSGRTQVSDAGAIDKENVTVEKSERVVGDIFNLTPEIERSLIEHDRSKPLSYLLEMIDTKILEEKVLPPSLLTYIRETSKPDESDILIVLKTGDGGFELQRIESYATDCNPDTLTRKRGGIIHAMLNKRREYSENKHFLLPIKNAKGQARFLYKSNLGYSILQNLRVFKM